MGGDRVTDMVRGRVSVGVRVGVGVRARVRARAAGAPPRARRPPGSGLESGLG